ncbi:hypothetical protein [Streptomyces hainanensis]|uniref:Secreted protein n=1 Tax=Streptomyces hainanensis TaxID=402648 RepID=A0A4R4TKE2_9ACTN|nr:hypothetical protein [Streptomyces hainanensis]TDC74559.1 hypothetical protein E1283_15335 [Streptomyces hainanensis]
MRRVLARCASPAALLAVVALLACAYVGGTTGALAHRVPAVAQPASEGAAAAMPAGADEGAATSDARLAGGAEEREAHAGGMGTCAEDSGRCLLPAAQPTPSFSVEALPLSVTGPTTAHPGPATPPTVPPDLPRAPDLSLLGVSRT